MRSVQLANTLVVVETSISASGASVHLRDRQVVASVRITVCPSSCGSLRTLGFGLDTVVLVVKFDT